MPMMVLATIHPWIPVLSPRFMHWLFTQSSYWERQSKAFWHDLGKDLEVASQHWNSLRNTIPHEMPKSKGQREIEVRLDWAPNWNWNSLPLPNRYFSFQIMIYYYLRCGEWPRSLEPTVALMTSWDPILIFLRTHNTYTFVSCLLATKPSSCSVF